MTHRSEYDGKGDRALKLSESGLKPSVIGERLGVSPAHVAGMIQRARQRREKLKEDAK